MSILLNLLFIPNKSITFLYFCILNLLNQPIHDSNATVESLTYPQHYKISYIINRQIITENIMPYRINSSYNNELKINNQNKNKKVDNLTDIDKNQIMDLPQLPIFDLTSNGYINQNYNYKIDKILFSDIQKQEYNVNQFNGKFLILYFWASWCLECLSGLKDLDTLQNNLNNNQIDDIKIIPISIDYKSITFLKSLYKQREIKLLELFVDKDKSAIAALSINSPPATFLISKQCSLIANYNDNFDWTDQNLYDALKNAKDNNFWPVELYPSNNNKEFVLKKDKNNSNTITIM